MVAVEIFGKRYEFTDGNYYEFVEKVLTDVCDKDELEVEEVINKLHGITHFSKGGLRKKLKEIKLQNKDKSNLLEESISPEEKEQCLHFLRSEDLLGDIMKELTKIIVGEQMTKLSIFLICMGVYVEDSGLQNNAFVNGESSAGKSHIASTVVNFFPANKRTNRTRITPRALNYLKNTKTDPHWTWDGQILCLAECEENVLNCETLRVMVTEGSFCTIVERGKAIDIEVRGKPIIVLTTAKSEPNAETLNRFHIIKADESYEQTEKIIEYQCRKEVGQELMVYDPIKRKSLSLLNRIKVRIPFAGGLAKFFPKDEVSMRRSFSLFLKLIKNSCALHQYQREQKDGYYLAQHQDYETAKKVWEHIHDGNIAKKPLTKRLEKGYKTCIELTEQQQWFSVSQAREKNPAISQREWYRIIKLLCQRGILAFREDIPIDRIRRVKQFSVKDIGKKIKLPTFEELINQDLKPR